ncbi:MAG: 50S ribosomal protein L4 [Helicobacter sp.]|nr:50S ribosomal protein L4 [Helicobacter sp.]
MSKAIVLDNNLKKSSEIELPKEYEQVNEHNLYLYVKSYLASLRANNAYAKNRGEVSGGGKKPWRQKKNGQGVGYVFQYIRFYIRQRPMW